MNANDRDTAEGILFTDQYQLTMAQLYFRAGIHEQRAQFDHFFRSYPDYGKHQAGYCVNAGLGTLLDWMRRAHFRDEDLAYLKAQKTRAGRPLFGDDFLTWLKRYGGFDAITMRAVPEGHVVHPYAPLTVIEGPLANAQLLESALLNQLNFQILIATKAARIRESSQGRTVLEFGMRRAQDKGANAGTRAALIGGADFSSNAGMSHVLGFPPKGTHAHSMVQAFIAMGGSELDAFRAYAEVYPDDCLLLVDTINTLESGLPNAIKVFEELRRKGHKPTGVRLDSGDLAYLSIQAAKMLDAAGFPETSIVLSNQLDELVMWQIAAQIRDEAPRYGVDPENVIRRLVYGVGTNLITSHGDPALDGVYKLVSLERNGVWVPAIKISETPAKTLNPGNKTVWRLYDQRGLATADLLCLGEEDPRQLEWLILRHPTDHTKFRSLRQNEISSFEPLLVEVLREGQLVYELPTIEHMRAVRQRDIERLDAGVRRLINPHTYHVSLSQKLWDLKQKLIEEAQAQHAIR
ncbi:MAG: nicotinate phosphoribosyltransferase [Anaerolineae bacterium]|nr:nicotinate phosphoribosyltransferase [Anaerolineae bacterium]